MLEHPTDLLLGLAASPFLKTVGQLESRFPSESLGQDAGTSLNFPEGNLLCYAWHQGQVDVYALRFHDYTLEQLHHFAELVVHKRARLYLVNPLHDFAKPSEHLVTKVLN